MNKLLMIIAVLILSSLVSAGTISGIPDVVKDNPSGEQFIVDLREYTSEKAYFSIVEQTNPRLSDCFIKNDYYIYCDFKEGLIGMSKITIEAIFENSEKDRDTFNINVNNFEQQGIEFYLNKSRITMENSDSANITAHIKNKTREKQCFELITELDNDERDEIRAETQRANFCLNAGEETSNTITITSFEDARNTNYEVEITLHSPIEKIRKELDIKVTGKDKPIDVIRTSDYYICKEPYTQEIQVRLENNTSSTKEILIIAEQDALMPYFEFPRTTLRGNETDEMALFFQTNQSTQTGHYTINVTAETEHEIVKREINFSLRDCGINREDTFDMKVTPENRRIEKGEKARFDIELTSKSDNDQYVYLSSHSDLGTRIEEYKVLLRANERETIRMEAISEKETESATYRIKVEAWNNDEREEDYAKVFVEPEYGIKVDVFNNNFEANVCSATQGQVFEVLIKNTGDYEEKIELEIDDRPESVQIMLSEEEIKLMRGEEATIYVFVNPAIDAPLGNYTTTLIVDSRKEKIEKELKFRVVEEHLLTSSLRLIYPEKIEMEKGETRTINFIIENNGDEKINNIKMNFYGLEEAMILNEKIPDLEKGESFTAEKIISVSENAQGTIRGSIKITSDKTTFTRSFTIQIKQEEPKKEEKNEIPLIGLLGLYSGEIFLGGVIILILLLSILIVLSLLNSNKSKRVVYYERGVQ